ncbi:MAG: fibronectin type III domain-containing protein [Prevotella sp.]|nr:fibronectin type III domain-containing protein [Prevotella sp.]
MRKLLLSLAVCMLVSAAFADERTVANGEYWIDNDINNRVEVTVNDGLMEFTADVNYLSEGLHALHYRAKDSEGAYSPVKTWLFFRRVAGGVTGTTIEYWADNLPHQSASANTGDVNFMFDASELAEGLHAFHYLLKDANGVISAERLWLFYRVKPQSEAEDCVMVYWIDDAQPQQATDFSTDAPFAIDANTLDEGIHTLHYYMKNGGGATSALHSWMFYKTSTAPKGTRIDHYRVWWNDYTDKAVEVKVPDGGSTFVYQDVLAMPDYAKNDGSSRRNTAIIHIQFFDELGNVSPIESAEVGYPDVYPPVTTLQVSTTHATGSVVLKWESNEDGVRDWNVYYAEGEQPYLLWKANTTEQKATFRGQHGSTYRFIVTARDVSGNYEAMEESKAVKVTF